MSKEPLLHHSHVLPIWKFVLYSVASFGLYELYWNYNGWKYFKEKDDLEISPFWRTFFMPLFLHQLFDNISNLLNKEGHNVSFPSALLVFFWIGMNIISRYDTIWLISYFSFLSFIPAISAMNTYWVKKYPNLPNKSLNWLQIILLIAGIGYFILIVIDTLVPV